MTISRGLYDPAFEHDACGVAFVATMTGQPTHEIVQQALTALTNLEHRGASGSEPDSGDGAGILIQVPDELYRAVVDFELPAPGRYGVGTAFLPTEPGEAGVAVKTIEAIAAEEGLTVLGWRDLPTDDSMVGKTARSAMPAFRQIFISGPVGDDELHLERLAFILRKRAERDAGVYFPSLSTRTIVYKGMLTTAQLEPFFPDLSDRRYATELAIVHSRFSTNTFPSWPLAHPFRLLAHNGEINTVKGNRNWMHARESQLASDVIPKLGRAEAAAERAYRAGAISYLEWAQLQSERTNARKQQLEAALEAQRALIEIQRLTGQPFVAAPAERVSGETP